MQEDPFYKSSPESSSRGFAFSMAILYLTIGTILPVYNKLIFGPKHGPPSSDNFPYPLTATMIQLAGVSVALILYSLISRCLWKRSLRKGELSVGLLDDTPRPIENEGERRGIENGGGIYGTTSSISSLMKKNNNNNNNNNPNNNPNNNNPKKDDKIQAIRTDNGGPIRLEIGDKSWVFGPGFLAKCGALLPVALLFALNISLSNLGLFHVPANIHILFRASETIWVVIFSYFMQSQVPSSRAMMCIISLAIGVTLVSLDYADDHPRSEETGVIDICINLASSIVAALQYIILRNAAIDLKLRLPSISHIEITTFKMALSLIFVIPGALIINSNGLSSLSSASTKVLALISGGVIITLTYQSALVALAAYTLSMTVAVVSQTKVPLQVLLSILILKESFDSGLQIVGTALVFLSSFYYGYLRYDKREKKVKINTSSSIVGPESTGSDTTDQLLSPSVVANSVHLINTASNLMSGDENQPTYDAYRPV